MLCGCSSWVNFSKATAGQLHRESYAGRKEDIVGFIWIQTIIFKQTGLILKGDVVLLIMLSDQKAPVCVILKGTDQQCILSFNLEDLFISYDQLSYVLFTPPVCSLSWTLWSFCSPESAANLKQSVFHVEIDAAMKQSWPEWRANTYILELFTRLSYCFTVFYCSTVQAFHMMITVNHHSHHTTGYTGPKTVLWPSLRAIKMSERGGKSAPLSIAIISPKQFAGV